MWQGALLSAPTPPWSPSLLGFRSGVPSPPSLQLSTVSSSADTCGEPLRGFSLRLHSPGWPGWVEVWGGEACIPGSVHVLRKQISDDPEHSLPSQAAATSAWEDAGCQSFLSAQHPLSWVRGSRQAQPLCSGSLGILPFLGLPRPHSLLCRQH